jgi:hypothetical protein
MSSTLQVVLLTNKRHPDISAVVEHVRSKGMHTPPPQKREADLGPGQVLRTVMTNGENFNEMLKEVKPDVWVIDARVGTVDMVGFFKRHETVAKATRLIKLVIV